MPELSIPNVRDIRIGLEFEIRPQVHRAVDAYTRLTQEARPLEQWDIGLDGSNVEFRTEGTISLGQFTESMAILAEFMASEWPRVLSHGCEYNSATGFHTHINTTAHIGPHVPRQVLYALYYFYAAQARSLIKDPETRLHGYNGHAYNSLIDIGSREAFLATVRGRREVQPNGLGTLELRLWDSTLDLELAARRQSFLEEWCEAALHVSEDEDRQEMVTTFSAMHENRNAR